MRIHLHLSIVGLAQVEALQQVLLVEGDVRVNREDPVLVGVRVGKPIDAIAQIGWGEAELDFLNISCSLSGHC